MYRSSHVFRMTLVRILSGLVLFALVLNVGCTSKSDETPTEDPSQNETQVALKVQLTIQARDAESTQAAMQATIDAQALQPTIPPLSPTVPTQQPVELIGGQPTIQATQALDQPTAVTGMDLDTFMQKATILVYEDMRVEPNTFPFVQTTLKNMGIPFTTVGGAKGNLKKKLLYEVPPGGWDLVIIAAEKKAGISGEFFDYIEGILDQGTSVIFEVWYLDYYSEGGALPLLQRCGVDVHRSWNDVPVRGQIMWPLRPDHPILNEPNSGMSFTDVSNYWANVVDLGDLMRLNDGSDAQFILGIKSSEPNDYATLTVCIDDQLILQTFSSHQITWNQMEKLWQNYIHFALQSRLNRIQ